MPPYLQNDELCVAWVAVTQRNFIHQNNSNINLQKGYNIGKILINSYFEVYFVNLKILVFTSGKKYYKLTSRITTLILILQVVAKLFNLDVVQKFPKTCCLFKHPRVNDLGLKILSYIPNATEFISLSSA